MSGLRIVIPKYLTFDKIFLYIFVLKLTCYKSKKKTPMTNELAQNINYFVAKLVFAKIKAIYNPKIINFNYVNDVVLGFNLYIELTAEESREQMLQEVEDCIRENLPELSIEVGQNEEQTDGWLNFYVSILDYTGFPSALGDLLSKPHVVLGHKFQPGTVFLTSDSDLQQMLNHSELPDYCTRMGWSPNKLTHYCMSNAGNKISPRWVIEFLFDIKPLPPYQIFKNGVLAPDFIYDHTSRAIKLMQMMNIPVLHGEKRGKKENRIVD